MSEKDGGPAPAIDLRGQALAGLMTSSTWNTSPPGDVAYVAYATADALLKARTQGE